MQTVQIAPFQIIGIKVRTSNENDQAASDIGSLWERFMTEGISQKINNKTSEEIFAIYTNYESDHTQPYDTIIGFKVDALDTIPEGMVGQAFDGGTYTKFTAKGDVTKGAVYQTWVDIWNTDLDRCYTADFEIYGAKTADLTHAEVDIFVAIKN